MFVLVGCAHETRAPATASRTTTTVVERQPVVVPVPAPTATGGGPDVDVDGPQRLDAARADRMVESRKGELRRECYGASTGTTSFILDISVAPDGRVERAETASVHGDRDVAECVRGKLLQMKFPQTVEGGTHSFTFYFGP